MANAIVSLRNLSVSYENTVALEGVNLDIYDDDFVGIIGPNGGGKTTLIKAIIGTLPYSGEIVYAPVLSSDEGLGIGYLPQLNEFDRSFPISVREVVVSGLQRRKGLMRARYRKCDWAKAEELMARMGIAHLADRPIGEVSGGQMQRALLCRAVISEPKLLILDEPTNFVDNQFEKELYRTLRELNERMAVIIVSHDIGTVTSEVKSIVCVNRHVHRHDSNLITAEQLLNYDCPIQIVSHGPVPHTVLGFHDGDCSCRCCSCSEESSKRTSAEK